MKKLEKVLILRLNKIGKNPHLVSDRETLESDWRQMNALLKALSVNTDPQSPNANAIEDNLRELVRLDLSSSSGHCQLQHTSQVYLNYGEGG